MAKNSAPKASAAPADKPARRSEAKPAYTIERARLLCPTVNLAANLERTFDLEPIDFEGIRQATETAIAHHASFLTPDPVTEAMDRQAIFLANMKERALEMHLQRIVGSFVGSACAAGEFYSKKVTEAKDLTAKLGNDDRDEDRAPVYGFETKAQRARQFAGQSGMQAFGLLAAAEGAIQAFATVTGSQWKPYQADVPVSQGVNRMAAQAEADAFDAR